MHTHTKCFSYFLHLTTLLGIFFGCHLQAACDPGVIEIKGGASHTLALESDGSVWAWGTNNLGQFGDGTTTSSPIPVPSGMLNAVTIGAGSNHSLAVRDDGTVWAWGANGSGQLGNGTTTDSLVPVQVLNLTNVIAAAGSSLASYALKGDGTVWAWGQGFGGQLGNGSTADSAIPVQSSISDVKAIAAYGQNAIVLKSDGTVWGWGVNANGELGNGTNTPASLPVQAIGIANARSVAAGDCTLALLSDGTVWAWGANAFGQMGTGTNTGSFTPVASLMTDGIAISAGNGFSLAIRADGTVWCWGQGTSGQLGNGGNANSNIPVQAVGFTDAIAVTSTADGSRALKSNAQVFAWGAVTGNVSSPTSNVPVQTSVFTGSALYKDTSAGNQFSLGLTSGGVVLGWGWNNVGQLGNGTNTDALAPVVTSVLTNVKAISAGRDFSLALRSDGTVWAWGNNTNGQLGNGTTTNSNIPLQVSGLSNVIAIAAGFDHHSLALLVDGTMWAWGANNLGQLGNGTTTGSTIPVPVSLIADAIVISAGEGTSYALLADGTARSWGLNTLGELGNGTYYLFSSLPTTVSALSNAKSLAAGDRHGLVILANGTAKSWGANSSGQLGDGTNAISSVPVAVLNLTDVKFISGGGLYSLALTADGAGWGWGYNIFGMLGNGTNLPTSIPGPVSSLTGLKTIDGGINHSLALASNGALWAWGDNSTGELGDGTTTNSLVPVPVSSLTPIATATPSSQTICSGQTTSIALSATLPNTTFDWTVVQTNVSGASSGSGTSIAQVLTATANVPGTAVYTVTPLNAGCSGAPINVTITVNPVPSVTATPASQSICSGTSTGIALTSNVGGTTFTWTVVQTNVSGASAGSGTSIAQTLTATTSAPGIAVYTITPAAGGCTGAPINVTVTVNPIPNVTATPAGQTICSGQSTGIALTSTVGGTAFAWTVIQTNVAGASNGSGASIAQVLTTTTALPGTAVYTITPSISGCTGTPIAVTVTVNPVPVVTATPASQTICSATSANIALTSTVSGTTFAWTVVQTNVSGASAGAGTSIAQILTATGNAPGTAVYTITSTAGGCTGTPIVVPVTVNPIPDAIATPPSQAIDSGQLTNIALTSTDIGTTFSWTVVQSGVTGALAGSGPAINQQLFTTTTSPGTATYTITPSIGTCAGTPVLVVIVVNPGIPIPPTNFDGFVTKNQFLTQTDLINVLSWTPSVDTTVTSYSIYQDGQLIQTVPASGPYEVILHNRQKGRIYTYAITAVNHSGESVPVVITLP